MKIKYVFYGLIALFVGYNVLFGGSDSSAENVEYEEVIEPTEGLITTVKEMETDLFKIEDEAVVPTPADSRIVAKYLDGQIDTFTLDEAKLVDAEGTGRRSGVMRAASYGLFGYMMGRRMGGSSGVRSSAYTDPKTHQRVTNNAGTKLNSTASRTTRVKPGSKGFGGGKSTRSVGG